MRYIILVIVLVVVLVGCNPPTSADISNGCAGTIDSVSYTSC